MRSRDMRRLLGVLSPLPLLFLMAFVHGPLPQAQHYHAFHDDRPYLGIPNFLNVISNAPFLFVGALGVYTLAKAPRLLPGHLRTCYLAMFVSILLTGLGSAYYHWAPDHDSLFWDRLPMAIGFMGLFAGFLAERLDLAPQTTIRLLAGLQLYGLGAVVYWAAYDDLRPYALAQFYPLLVIPILVWRRRGKHTSGRDWLVALGFYIFAKVLEMADGQIYALSHLASGHSLKHLAAAAGAYWLYLMITRERAGSLPVSPAATGHLYTSGKDPQPPQVQTTFSQ